MKITIRTITLILTWLLGPISYGVQASCKSDSGAQKESNLVLNLDSLSLSSETTGTKNLSLSSSTFSCSPEWFGSSNRIAIISEMPNGTAYVDYGNYILQFKITNLTPNEKDLDPFGESNISGSSLNNVEYTYKTKILKYIPKDANPSYVLKAKDGEVNITIPHAISVVDISGIDFWFPGVHFAEFLKWIVGIIGSDEEKRLLYQNITINYRPHVTTCSIADTTVTLPETDLTSLISNEEVLVYKNFILKAECSDLLEGMSTRAIQFYFSSSNVDSDRYTLRNAQGSARNIGVRIMRSDINKKIAISPSRLSVSSITSEYEFYHIDKWGENFDIPLRAYYYIYGKNPTQGTVQTTAQVNLV
ncbi:hypothetical protein EBN95_23075, partial [Salmonella enterica]|nr:hypothetical protein [Salmonella enterica]